MKIEKKTYCIIQNKLYKKEDIYNKLDVPKEQQKGKWHNGYCEHNNEWFIFANVNQIGFGFSKNQEFDYNNSIDATGDLNWEAINNSNLTWTSIQKLKVSSPFIFIRKPETKKHMWEYLGKGNCVYTLDTSPVKFKWKISGETNIIKVNIDVTKKHHEKNLKINNDPDQDRKNKYLNNSTKKNRSKTHKVKSGKIDLLTRNKFKKMYDSNPFIAFSEFKSYVQTNLKIKSSTKVKMIWNEEIIKGD